MKQLLVIYGIGLLAAGAAQTAHGTKSTRPSTDDNLGPFVSAALKAWRR